MTDERSVPGGDAPPERARPDDRRQRGMDKMQEVYNFSVDPADVPGDFLALTVDHLFGDIWTRPELDVRERRLMTIGVLAALGRGQLLEVQFDSALHNEELSENQVRAVVVHLAHYVGWPLATVVNQAAEQSISRYGTAPAT